jgi:NAD(P)-dependent dehydrogenase (short-subunit alcohol dehydrogenase family)
MERLFATNVVGPTLMTQAALPALKATRGAVVNVSSTAGIKPAPPVAQYGATKAALDHLTRCWALELAPSGVRVNAVAPGPTESGMLDRVGFPAHVQEMIRQDEARRVPLGRRGTADEVASWIVALAHPSASWVTGQVIAIDGGLTLT